MVTGFYERESRHPVARDSLAYELGGQRLMYGVPTDLPVERFVGHELNQVCLGRFQVQFHCSGTGSIFVEGRWELRDKTGALLDSVREHSERLSYQIHRILDVPIERAAVDPPRSFALFFK